MEKNTEQISGKWVTMYRAIGYPETPTSLDLMNISYIGIPYDSITLLISLYNSTSHFLGSRGNTNSLTRCSGQASDHAKPEVSRVGVSGFWVDQSSCKARSLRQACS